MTRMGLRFVRLLRGRGADINRVDKPRSHKPLIYAQNCEYAQLVVVRPALECGDAFDRGL